MAWSGRSVLAVIPARGGSKGIPRKNLREVGGASLVGRAARLAASLPYLDAAVVSTDDAEIRDEAVAHGAHAPFMRPADLAGDRATSVDMWRHAWLASEAHYGRTFDAGILLEPTSPMRTEGDVERTLRALLDGPPPAPTSAATVSPTPAHFTPHKTLTLDPATGLLGFHLEGGARHTLRQSIPAFYHRNGLCYAVCRAHLVDGGRILDASTVGVVVDRRVVNIDDPADLDYAEWLMERTAADRRP